MDKISWIVAASVAIGGFVVQLINSLSSYVAKVISTFWAARKSKKQLQREFLLQQIQNFQNYVSLTGSLLIDHSETTKRQQAEAFGKISFHCSKKLFDLLSNLQKYILDNNYSQVEAFYFDTMQNIKAEVNKLQEQLNQLD